MIDEAFIEDVFARFGKVSVKRMFGGQGIYAHGVMFALAFEAIYIKADEAMREELRGLESKAFVYPLMKKPPRARESGFWRLPESALDDPDEAALWARRAMSVAQAKKNKPAKRRPAR